MSRIGKLPVAIPAGVEVTINGQEYTAAEVNFYYKNIYTNFIKWNINNTNMY